MRLHTGRALSVLALVVAAGSVSAQTTPAAIYTDPPHNAKFPARMEVLHIPSGSVRINGVAYLAVGAGKHPTFVFFHGLPGNEKNLDLAQAVRRAGWNAITVNYRGSWGSPGEYRFANNLEDAGAVLAYLRDTANARRLGVDTTRLVIAGHSMGGWVVAHTAARDHGLRGAILISSADMGRYASAKRADVAAAMVDDMETLASTSPDQMADELIANGKEWGFEKAAPGLASVPMLVLTSNDGLAPMSDSLVKWTRARGNKRITVTHVATDHSWSDRRILLQTDVLRWLQSIRR